MKSNAGGGTTQLIRHARAGLAARRTIFVVAVPIAFLLLYWVVFAPVQVTIYEVRRGPVVSEVMGTGTLEARIKATISPKISGRIAQVLTDQGKHVKVGQLLVKLDDAELLQEVEIAAAGVAVTEAGLDRLKAGKDRALAVLHQAEFDHNWTSELFAENTATSIEVARATEALNIAQAELARAQASIIEGQEAVLASQRTLAFHQARLADTQIIAPFDGLIVRRHRDPGDVVVPGSPVLSLISTDELWISAWVDETVMMGLRPGQLARAVFRSHPERAYRGKVSRLGREADRETREFVVDVQVLELPENWAVGQRAEVYIETARKDDVTVLPASYLRMREEMPGVYVEENGYAAWRPVTIGLRSGDSVEVIEGLQAGDRVLAPADPKIVLRQGRRVKPAR